MIYRLRIAAVDALARQSNRRADVGFWHKADITSAWKHVRYWGHSGHHPQARRCPLMTQSGHGGAIAAASIAAFAVSRINPALHRQACRQPTGRIAKSWSAGTVRSRSGTTSEAATLAGHDSLCRGSSRIDDARTSAGVSLVGFSPDRSPDGRAQCQRALSAVRGHHSFHMLCRLAVSEARLALADFYDVAIRIANVAVRLAIRFLWLCDELGSSISPKFIARANIRNADIHKAAD